MLKSLKFCAGSVAKKEIVASLTHFLIEDGRVRGFNGTLALSSPIPFNITCKPKADTLIKAIANCDDAVKLTMTKAGRLSIKSGKYKAFVDCVEGDTHHVEPEGEMVDVDGEAFIKGLRAVSPFVGEDASRIWAQGVLVKDGSLFATNNVILVQYWMGVQFPCVVNIPRATVKELMRINEAPVGLQVAENSITFHFEGDRWLRTQLYPTEWPDLDRILNGSSAQEAIDPELFEGLEVIKPFVNALGDVYTGSGRIATSTDENEGASYDLAAMEHPGRYHFKMLGLLKGAADTIDWSQHPAPCLFTGHGKRLRGAIIGMKL